MFGKESESRVRRSLCDVIVQVQSLSEEWPQLFPMVASACQSDGEIRVESLYLLGEICNNDESVSSCIYFFI